MVSGKGFTSILLVRDTAMLAVDRPLVNTNVSMRRDVKRRSNRERTDDGLGI